jgi:ferredoxin
MRAQKRATGQILKVVRHLGVIQTIQDTLAYYTENFKKAKTILLYREEHAENMCISCINCIRPDPHTLDIFSRACVHTWSLEAPLPSIANDFGVIERPIVYSLDMIHAPNFCINVVSVPNDAIDTAKVSSSPSQKPFRNSNSPLACSNRYC